MDTISTFLVVVVGVAIAVFLAIGALPIVMADRHKTLARGPYVQRVAGVVAAFVAAYILQRVSTTEIAGFALGAVAAVFLTLWSVHRCQHLGWSRWCCLLFLVPLANLGLLLLLLIKPDAKPGAAA